MLSTILTIVCLLLFIIRYKSRHNYWKERDILQVNDLLLTFMFGNRSMVEICKSHYDRYDTPHIGTFMGTTPTLILKNIQDIRAVLTSNFQNFHSRGIRTNPSDILADNLLFMSDYRRWKLVRHNMLPVFSGDRLKPIFYVFEKCARDLVEVVEDNTYARQRPFSILYTYTTASIGAFVIGVDMHTQVSTMDSPFLDMTWKSLDQSLDIDIKVYLANIFPKLFKFLHGNFFGEHEDFFIDLVKHFIDSRRRCNMRTFDFMENCLLLQTHGMMQDFNTGYELRPTVEILAAQAFGSFIAGADTTANAMHFTLLELASHQDFLKKLHEEIDGVFGDYKEELSYEDVEKLQYLDMVINESLRMYPPIGFIQRMCTNDTILPGEVRIDKGTAVIIPIFAIHRDGNYYPNPDQFDPERFRKGTRFIEKFKYLPFGEGHRNCIGNEVARVQLKVGLAWLLRRFTLYECKYTPRFEPTTFALRNTKAHYHLIVRDIFDEDEEKEDAAHKS